MASACEGRVHLWGGKKYLCVLFHLGLSFICFISPSEFHSSATFYFSLGSINQWPLEILNSSFQKRRGVFSGGSQTRPPGLLVLKPDSGSRILISCMITDVYHSFVFVFVSFVSLVSLLIHCRNWELCVFVPLWGLSMTQSIPQSLTLTLTITTKHLTLNP